MSVRENTLLRNIAQWRQHSLFWPLVLVLGVLLVIQLIRLVLVVITPVTPLGGWQPNQAQAMPMGARAAILTSFNPFDRSSTTPADNSATPVTSLDLTLYGIRINSASGGGSAIIAGSDGVQAIFAVGEEVLPGVTLAAVAFDHAVLDRGGTRESLFIDQSGSLTPVSPPDGDAAANAGAAAGETPPAGTPQADGQPAKIPDVTVALDPSIDFDLRAEGGKITGVEVWPQGDGKGFKKFGFRPGDVIVEYDGRPVRSADDVKAMVAKSTPGGRFSVMVERGGNLVPIAIIVPEK